MYLAKFFRVIFFILLIQTFSFAGACLSSDEIRAYAPDLPLLTEAIQFETMDLAEVPKYLPLLRNLPFFVTENCAGKILDDVTWMMVKKNQSSLAKWVEKWENSEPIIYDDAMTDGKLKSYNRYLEVYPQGKHSLLIRKLRAPLLAGEEKNRIELLKQRPTVKGFESYLRDYPEGSWVLQAKIRLKKMQSWKKDSLKIEEIVQRKNIKALIDFRKEHQNFVNNPFLETKAWQIVKDRPSLKKIRWYQKGWPTGKNIAEARELKEKLRQEKERIDRKNFMELKQNKTLENCREFLSQNSASDYFSEAEVICNKIEEKESQKYFRNLRKSKDYKMCLEFSKHFPSAKNAKDVQIFCSKLQVQIYEKKAKDLLRNISPENCSAYLSEVTKEYQSSEAVKACDQIKDEILKQKQEQKVKQEKLTKVEKVLCKESVRIKIDLPKRIQKAKKEGNNDLAEQLTFDLQDLNDSHKFSLEDYSKITKNNWVFDASDCEKKYGIKSRW